MTSCSENGTKCFVGATHQALNVDVETLTCHCANGLRTFSGCNKWKSSLIILISRYTEVFDGHGDQGKRMSHFAKQARGLA